MELVAYTCFSYPFVAIDKASITVRGEKVQICQSLSISLFDALSFALAGKDISRCRNEYSIWRTYARFVSTLSDYGERISA